MDTKTRPIYMLSSRDPLHFEGHIIIERESWKKIFHAARDQKKDGVAILTSDKMDLKIENIIGDKDIT